MTMMPIRPTTLRRTCTACEQPYSHSPVTASGKLNGEHKHVIACSWPCLERLVAEVVDGVSLAAL